MPLRSKHEISYNVMWRFLQLRGYVNDKHELSVWGSILEAALATLDPADKVEEYILIGIEMLRLGLVNARDLATVPGGAVEGTGKRWPLPSTLDKHNPSLTDATRRSQGHDQSHISRCRVWQVKAQICWLLWSIRQTAAVLQSFDSCRSKLPSESRRSHSC